MNASRSNNPEGRPKGALNKTTKEVREVLTSAISAEVPFMLECLERLRTKDERAYLQAMTKLIAFVVPKPQEIEHNQVNEVREITFNVVKSQHQSKV
jgi:hypothetical protein